MRIRKHLSKLTLPDLDQHPVWTGIMDTYESEEDEREEDTPWTMTPYPEPYDPAQPLKTYVVCVIRAEFTLANGETRIGYLKAKGKAMTGVEHVQPTIVTEQGQIDFYTAIRKPSPDEIAENYELLGETAERVFPVRYRGSVFIVDGPNESTLNGFYWLNVDNSDRTVEAVR